MGIMTVFVMVDSWQQQCCGDDIEVGSDVRWDVQVPEAGSSWVGWLLGDEWGHKVRYREHHHDGDATVALAGVVRSIHVLTCDLTPNAGNERADQRAPGTGRLTSIQVIDKWAPEPRHDPNTAPTESFVGWIVELQTGGPDAT